MSAEKNIKVRITTTFEKDPPTSILFSIILTSNIVMSFFIRLSLPSLYLTFHVSLYNIEN